MLSYKPQPTQVESLCQIQSDTTGVLKQGEKSRYQLHTWEVLQFPINTVRLLQVLIPQEQREELQEVR